MNDALLYLWLALLRRRSLRFVRSLRRPTALIGLTAVLVLLGFLFYFRDHQVMGQLVRKENLIGGIFVMLCGSVFKGFLQRGLLCEPADVEFLFTSPFTHRQIVLYRLLPNYLFAILQSVVFYSLFYPHLRFPVLTAVCLIFLQVSCFHLATAAAIFGGTLSDPVHHRARWMMLFSFFLIAAVYLRLAWGFRIVPSFCSGSLCQLLFYPAVTLADVGSSIQLHHWVLQFEGAESLLPQQFWRNTAFLCGFAFAAAGSFWLLLRFKANPFEAALSVTSRVAEKRRRLQQGRRTRTADSLAGSSVALPKLALFRGSGAILWKNWVAVRRCRREMLLAAFFVLTYTGFFTALLWIFHDLAKKAGGAPLYEARGFTTGIALFLGILAFFLQRMFPFDFRRDGQHLLTFRTLPVSPWSMALAQVAIPTILCLLAQACGIIPLIFLGSFDGPTLVFVLLGYPAVALALNSVWNIHYLTAATKQLSGRASSSSAVGVLMVVALSFLVLFPAGWITIKVANHFVGQTQSLAFTLATGSGLAVQYGIDLLLVWSLARLFQRFELTQDS